MSMSTLPRVTHDVQPEKALGEVLPAVHSGEQCPHLPVTEAMQGGGSQQGKHGGEGGLWGRRDLV